MHNSLQKERPITIGVMCGASPKCSPKFAQASSDIAEKLAGFGYKFVYGGGSFGLMGAFASSALLHGAEVIGVMPGFMQKVEWNHSGLSELILTEDFGERKAKMYQLSDHILILPGGLGTLDELFDVIMKKRFGLFMGKIIIFNQDGFFDDLLTFLKSITKKNFAESTDRSLWVVANNIGEISAAINSKLKAHKTLLARCEEERQLYERKDTVASIWTTSM